LHWIALIGEAEEHEDPFSPSSVRNRDASPRKEKAMRVQDIMTKDPACCTEHTSLVHVARLMLENDCGAIPVVEDIPSKRLVGMITDRDIVTRTLAKGRDPFPMAAGECMSRPVATVTPEDGLDECASLMEEHQVQRIPVVDGKGCCCGIVAQTDLAQTASEQRTADVLQHVSQPTWAGPLVGAAQ
jgi:CBS domain-containing protein